MAQYEATIDQLKPLLEDNSGLSPTTRDAIQTLLDGGMSMTVLEGKQSGTDSSEGVIADKNTNFGDGQNHPVVFDKATVAVLDENASGDVAFVRENDITLDIVNPNGLAVDIKNNNDNDITWHNGQASITTGDGDDNIAVEGLIKGQIKTGAGDLNLSFDQTAQEQAEISVDAGDGFDVMTLFGAAIKHQFSFQGGKFKMESANVEMKNMELVATDVNEDGKIENGVDHITVLAANEQTSLIAKLYLVALGREAIDGNDGWSADGKGDTLGGLHWWTTEFAKNDSDHSMEHLVRSFLNCDEFRNKYEKMSNTDYVNTLYSNLGINEGDLAEEYIDMLNKGVMDREMVAWEIASSDDAVRILGNDGKQYVINGYDDGLHE